MVAHVEVSGGAGGWSCWWVAADYEFDTEHAIGVTDDSLREWEVEVDTDE